MKNVYRIRAPYTQELYVVSDSPRDALETFIGLGFLKEDEDWELSVTCISNSAVISPSLKEASPLPPSGLEYNRAKEPGEKEPLIEPFEICIADLTLRSYDEYSEWVESQGWRVDETVGIWDTIAEVPPLPLKPFTGDES